MSRRLCGKPIRRQQDRLDPQMIILWPRDRMPVEDLEYTLLRTVMRCAGVIPNIWNRSAVARALHWTTLKDPERKKHRSPPCKQTDSSHLSINEMHRRTLTIALRIARTNDAQKYRSTILAALRFFHRHKTDRRAGHPEADRSRLGIVTAVLRRPREKNVQAIAKRMAMVTPHSRCESSRISWLTSSGRDARNAKSGVR